VLLELLQELLEGEPLEGEPMEEEDLELPQTKKILVFALLEPMVVGQFLAGKKELLKVQIVLLEQEP